jgi:uncharacterized protein (DUF2147 family)
MRRREWLLLAAAGIIGALALGRVPAEATDTSTPVGVWRTIDDATKKPRALVQIFARNGLLYGRVSDILDPRFTDARCVACSGDRQNQPVQGLEIIRDMRPDGDHWDGGTILDPQTGAVYHCRMHLGPDGQTLVVRGFIGFSLLGRSQTWQRMPAG